MKNKKSYISIVIVLVLLTLQTTPVFALKQATFPDSKSVQPLPKDVYPNISGNVNSTVGTPPESESLPLDKKSESSSMNQSTQEAKDDSSSSYLVWSIIIFFIVVIIFIIYYKKRKSS
jgi:hypothetical protein